jgi:hypothetical protein
LEALLLTARPFALVFLAEVLVNLGEATASSDAGDRFSSFMAADGFPKFNAPHWTTPNFQRLVEYDSCGFVCNHQQLSCE